MDHDVKEMLQRRANDASLRQPDLPPALRRRARHRRALNAGVAGLTAAAVVASVFVGIEVAEHHRTSRTPGTSASASFPGLWPASDRAGLGRFQRAVDNGRTLFPDPTSPVQVATAFAHQELGWNVAEVKARVTRIPGGERGVDVSLWNTVVTKRAGVRPRDPAYATKVSLEQLGKTGPTGVWEIVGVRSGLIVLECPPPYQTTLEVAKPQRLCGSLVWTPAEGHIDAIAYLNGFLSNGRPRPPVLQRGATIAFPRFEGTLPPMPDGRHAPVLLVRLEDPEGFGVAMVARRFSTRAAQATTPATPTTMPVVSPSSSAEHFVGIWPVASAAELAAFRVDTHTYVAAPATEAVAFASSVLGWKRSDIADRGTVVRGDTGTTTLWNRQMGSFSPQVALEVGMQRIQTTGRAIWLVTKVETGLLSVRCPAPYQDLIAPGRRLRICGSLTQPPAGWLVQAIVRTASPASTRLMGGAGANAADMTVHHQRFTGFVPLGSNFDGRDADVAIRVFAGNGTVLGFYVVRVHIAGTR